MSVFTFTPMPSVPHQMGRLFDEFWRDGKEWNDTNGVLPSVDIAETASDFVLTVEVPGLTKEDIQVTLQQNVVSVKGDKKAPEQPGDVKVRRAERIFGSFSRSFRLPKDVRANSIKASCKDGVLTITLPKSEAAKPREIDIRF